MRSLIFANLTTRKPAVDSGGSNLTLPPLVAGQQWTTGLRFTERTEGTYGEIFPAIHSLRASIGVVDARAETGTWRLQVGAGASTEANTTPALDWNIPPTELAARLNALTGSTDFSVDLDGGSYVIRRATGAQFVLQARGNRLRPVSMVRLREFQQDGEYAFDVRLVQAPLAFTDTAEPVLPDQPYVVTVVDGFTSSDGTYMVNEVQNLMMPPDFRGVYYFKRGLARSSLLSTEDGSEEIQTALNALLAIEGGTVVVTNPQTGVARIEFGGDLAGGDVAQLEIFVAEEGTPPGDWTFTLDLNASEIWAALRAQETLKVPYEVEAEVYIDPDNHAAGTRTVKLWRETVTLSRPVMWEGLAAAQNIDWLRPPSPKTYVPFNLSQVLTGQQQAFSAVVGDGSTTEFVLDHNLASELCQVVVRENAAGGRLLRPDEYRVVFDSNNVLTINFASGVEAFGAPALIAAVPGGAAAHGELTVFVVAIGPASVFQSHTHPIEQVDGLESILDDLGGRVAVLEGILPSTGPGATSSQASGIDIALPETKEILFFKGTGDEQKALFGDAGIEDAAKLGRAPLLLPAVHKASLTDYASGALPAVAADTVWTNASADTLNMGRGLYGGKVPHDGFFASDGRVLYAVDHAGTSKSYFPTGFDRELFRIFCNDKMLRLNRTLDVQFGLALQLVNATSNAQWLLVIEHGAAPSQTEPATTALNLENIEWEADPLLSQRLILTGNRQTHSFGARINRSLVASVDTITADTLLYGVWEGADALAPAGANFALRARLIQFDTENALASDARGWVAYEILGATTEGKPTATIT